jgi:hypothetical protein
MWATDGGTYNASKSEGRCTLVQRASTESSDRSALRLDPGSSSSTPNSVKCDMAVGSTDQVP